MSKPLLLSVVELNKTSGNFELSPSLFRTYCKNEIVK